MNTETLQREAHLLKLRLNYWWFRLAVALEPAGSTEMKSILKSCSQAKGRLDRALLNKQEIRLEKSRRDV